MATQDFSPLFRTTVGFDRVPGILAQALERADEAFPPYNIEKCGENAYRIALAVAGFSADDLEVVTEPNMLTVRGRQKGKCEGAFLHRGIPARNFERVFDLADYVEVTGAAMGDGLLIIDLKRELPAALKPRRIEIAPAVMKHFTAPAHGAAA